MNPVESKTPRACCPGFSRLRAIIAYAVILVSVFAVQPSVQACSVCFGKSDSALAQGMNMGIFTLLIFIGGVLGALACFFVFLAVRSSKLPHPEAIGASANSPDNPAHS